jgi:lysophospholipase L1-like esterase
MKIKLTLAILSGLVFCFGVTVAASRQDTTGSQTDTLKIVYFGSSVPYGVGATKSFGYTAMYTRLLKQRADAGIGKPWQTVNKSIGGDNTVKILKRWQRDLVPQKAKYVIYALSLGNDSIHEKGKPYFDRFKTNMTKLIGMARDSGYVPVLTNCYTREDFTPADHDYVKAMNLWIQTLDVPSINLLGAVDNGWGKWATGYMHDRHHPNDAGHAEMFYTVVPSLFDALANHKPQPVWVNSAGISWNSKNKTLLSFKPENIVHSFTSSVTVKIGGAGHILQIKDSTGRNVNVLVNKSGFLEYQTDQGKYITGTIQVNDGKWHKVTLSHYYALGRTYLYCDNTLQGDTQEKLKPTELYLGDDAGKGLAAKSWLFYRSAMNALENEALTKDKLLKSSLELYAPLNGKGDNALSNLAQSTNTVKWLK